MDPYGHLAPWLYKDIMDKDDVEIRPTIAITRAHMKLPELEESVRKGRLVPDGKICINETGEVAVTKVAVEPVWYLPGVAERFNIGTYMYDRESNTSRLTCITRRGDTPSNTVRGDWRLLPRADYAPRHQALPPSHWWSYRIHLRRPSKDVEP